MIDYKSFGMTEVRGKDINNIYNCDFIGLYSNEKSYAEYLLNRFNQLLKIE